MITTAWKHHHCIYWAYPKAPMQPSIFWMSITQEACAPWKHKNCILESFLLSSRLHQRENSLFTVQTWPLSLKEGGRTDGGGTKPIFVKFHHPLPTIPKCTCLPTQAPCISMLHIRHFPPPLPLPPLLPPLLLNWLGGEDLQSRTSLCPPSPLYRLASLEDAVREGNAVEKKVAYKDHRQKEISFGLCLGGTQHIWGLWDNITACYCYLPCRTHLSFLFKAEVLNLNLLPYNQNATTKPPPRHDTAHWART